MRLECRTDRRGNPFELPKKQLTHDGHFELWRKGHAYGNARLEAVRTHLPAIVKRFDQDATTTQPAEANLSTFRFIRYRNFQSKLHLRSLTSARTRWVKNESQRVQTARRIPGPDSEQSPCSLTQRHTDSERRTMATGVAHIRVW